MKNEHPPFKQSHQIKDFEYPVACNSVQITPNQKRIITLGIYKPSVKLYDLNSLSLKFERHLAADGLKVVSLTEDAEKFTILRRDRTIEFHTRNGLHEQVKVPYQPKDMLFNTNSSEIYLSGNYSSIYRFNLEQGRFLRGINAGNIKRLAYSNINGLILGLSEGRINIIDSRNKELVLCKRVDDYGLLSVDFRPDGICYAVSTNQNKILEFDLRSEEAIRIIDTKEEASKIKYCGKQVFASAGEQIYVLNEDEGTTEIDVGYNINDFDVVSDFLVVGGENEEMSYYVSDK